MSYIDKSLLQYLIVAGSFITFWSLCFIVYCCVNKRKKVEEQYLIERI